MTQLPTDPIRDEHHALVPHLAHMESAATRVTEWDPAEAGSILPRIVAFLRDDLVPHATVEEELLYPAVDRLAGANVTATMTVDHVVIGERIEALAAAVELALGQWENRDLVNDLSRQLASIAAIVSLHFRKEEEVLLPILDAGMSSPRVTSSSRGWATMHTGTHMAEPVQDLPARVYQALSNVWDPELGIDIVSLGLIYEVRVGELGVEVDMTLTTPGCPVSDSLPWEARQMLSMALPEVLVQFNLVWDPPWTPERLSETASRALGLDRAG